MILEDFGDKIKYIHLEQCSEATLEAGEIYDRSAYHTSHTNLKNLCRHKFGIKKLNRLMMTELHN